MKQNDEARAYLEHLIRNNDHYLKTWSAVEAELVRRGYRAQELNGSLMVITPIETNEVIQRCDGLAEIVAWLFRSDNPQD